MTSRRESADFQCVTWSRKNAKNIVSRARYEALFWFELRKAESGD